MPHDGQDVMEMQAAAARLDGLMALTAAAVPTVEALQDKAIAALRTEVASEGRVSGAALEANQHAVHGLAWLATYVEALRQMQHWADKLSDAGTLGEVEELILQIGFGEYLAQLTGGIQVCSLMPL